MLCGERLLPATLQHNSGQSVNISDVGVPRRRALWRAPRWSPQRPAVSAKHLALTAEGKVGYPLVSRRYYGYQSLPS
jgi:hypothetical protein